MSELYSNLKLRIKTSLVGRFNDDYSVYLNNETTNDLVLNFHERKYHNDMDNQINVKPIVIRVSTDVLSDISEMPNYVNGMAITKVGDFIKANLKDNPTMLVIVPTSVYQG
jgi:hypothetical protein